MNCPIIGINGDSLWNFYMPSILGFYRIKTNNIADITTRQRHLSLPVIDWDFSHNFFNKNESMAKN